MKLEACPCCLGKAGLTDMMIGNTKMWQVSCSTCGLSTELDDDKMFSVERWNRRLEKARLKTWVTFLAGFLPFIAIAFFLMGSYLSFILV